MRSVEGKLLAVALGWSGGMATGAGSFVETGTSIFANNKAMNERKGA